MTKVLIILLFAYFSLPSLLLAEVKNRYFYTSSPECFIKRYRNKEFEIVPDKTFHRIELIVQSLKRNPQIKAFKYKGDIYLTPESCLKPSEYNNTDLLENLDDIAINDRGRAYFQADDQSINNSEYQSPRSSSKVKLKDYYIAISGGKNFVSSQENIFPWEKLIGYIDDEIDPTEVISGAVPLKTKYNTELIKQLEFGYRSGTSYINFRFKNFEAKKGDTANITLANGLSAPVTFNFSDSISNFYLGFKYLYRERETFQPFVNLLIGATFLDSTLIFEEEKIELSNASIAAIVETGSEIRLADNFALNLALGYELLTHKSLRVKDKNSSSGTTNDGFNPAMNYSNFYSTAGIVFYW